MKREQQVPLRTPHPELRTPVTYREAGVDIRATNRLLERFAPLIRSTHGPEVLPDIGQFAGLFRFPMRRFCNPVLVSSTDGVGTKLKVAQLLNAHASIGVDVVAMNANDVLAYGARPLFFLDYIAMGKVKGWLLGELLRGIALGCRASGCALLGGETAEMPGLYEKDEYDVAGFCVGVVERRNLIEGSKVRKEDSVVGLASSGVHANGFSLIRSIFTPSQLRRLRHELLVPTRIYVKPVLAALGRFGVTSIAHVTGGGLIRRLSSLVARKPTLQVRWMPGSWPVPKIFRAIQQAGRVDAEEMYGTFNMGIGMALVCRAQDAGGLIQMLKRQGVSAWRIGRIEPKRDDRVVKSKYVDKDSLTQIGTYRGHRSAQIAGRPPLALCHLC